MKSLNLYTYNPSKQEPELTDVQKGQKLKELNDDLSDCHCFHLEKARNGDEDSGELDLDCQVEDIDFNDRDSILFHRCKTLNVTVMFNNEDITRRFPVFKPARDVLEFALKKFNIDENEDMALAPKQGVREAIDLENPIGCYSSVDDCEVTLYLVTEQFIQGFTHPGIDKLTDHIKSPLFQRGVDNKKWGIVEPLDQIESTWPKLTVWVQPAKKENSPKKYYLRFDLSGYPQKAPTATLWDIDNDQKLPTSQWPSGKKKLVDAVFKQSWKNGDCLYVPCDRKSCQGSHRRDWQKKHPHLMWKSGEDTIHKYVSYIHKILNSRDYQNA